MTFTYDLASSDAQVALISRVRLEIGDTVENDGVTPSGSNLSDEEITIFLDRESDDELRAAAAACEALARQWARVANIAVGPRREDLGKVAAEWRASAAELRRQYGYGEGGMISAGVMRVDGYSDDVASDDVETGGVN
ncbi:MAG: hypothetical protein JXB07_18920 [Anaerolineae bacterium]|nr:hypothetical protein [Anaerolineae bacterium]